MPDSFHQITQSLRRDHGLPATALCFLGFFLSLAWLLWAFTAHVTHYEVSESARLEISASAYPVEANISGQMAVSHMVLGREVHPGDLLAELDSSAEQLSLREEQARLASLDPQFEALDAQMDSERAGNSDERNVLDVAQAAASAQIRQADAQAALAETEARRNEALRSAGVLSAAEAERSSADAKSKRAAADSLRSTATALVPQLQVRARDREIRLRQLLEQKRKLESDRAASQAAIQKLQYEVERRQIRAMVGGQLAECATVPAGSHITEGQKLGVVLPEGHVEVVAEFLPASALGKIHPGQTAALRLDGFPWAQYGTVTAQVLRVANEIRDGKVRVDLAVTAVPHSAIRLQHGVPGTVEIATEITTPATLLFRSAGALAGAH